MGRQHLAEQVGPVLALVVVEAVHSVLDRFQRLVVQLCQAQNTCRQRDAVWPHTSQECIASPLGTLTREICVNRCCVDVLVAVERTVCGAVRFIEAHGKERVSQHPMYRQSLAAVHAMR